MTKVKSKATEKRKRALRSTQKIVEMGKRLKRRKQFQEFLECLHNSKKRSSYKERKGNALASGADEGRDKLRKAAGSGKYA